jgi:predicted acyl esterase
VVAAVLPTAAGSARGAVDPNAHVRTATYITSPDGTKLRTWVYRPAGLNETDKTPVILQVTPYAGSGGAFGVPPDLESLVNTEIPPGPGFPASAQIFARGYSLVVVELRGYGGSGGCFDFGGRGEQSDAVAAVRWSATQPWSTGKVGMVGHSYDGETQLMAMKHKPEGLAAVILGAPPSGYRNLYTNGVRNLGGGTAFGAYYAASDLWPASLGAPPEEHLESLGGTATHADCYATTTLGTYNTDPRSTYWRDRDLLKPNVGNTIPTMYAQGFNDWNVRTTNFLPEFTTLNGPKRGFFGPWDHGIPSNGNLYVSDQMAWFDRWLKGIVTPDRPPVSVQDTSGRWRAEEDWPPPDGVAWTMRLRSGSYLNAPGNSAETGLPAQFPVEPPAPLPTARGLWTITQRLPHAVHLAGVPTVKAKIAAIGAVNIVALVYDIDASGNARFVERGAFLARGSGTHTFPLYPRDWRFEAGHRIGVLLTGADDVWFEPNGLTQNVTVAAAWLTAPILRRDRSTFLPTGPFNPRGEHAPFVLDEATIASSDIVATLPDAPAADLPVCSAHDAAWWSGHTTDPAYGSVASRAARRSFGLFASGADVTSALASGGARRDLAAHLLNLASADLGSLSGLGGIEPGAKLAVATYDPAVVGDTARAAAYFVRSHIDLPEGAAVAADLASGNGIMCP